MDTKALLIILAAAGIGGAIFLAGKEDGDRSWRSSNIGGLQIRNDCSEARLNNASAFEAWVGAHGAMLQDWDLRIVQGESAAVMGDFLETLGCPGALDIKLLHPNGTSMTPQDLIDAMAAAGAAQASRQPILITFFGV